jgi:hypothetical protein
MCSSLTLEREEHIRSTKCSYTLENVALPLPTVTKYLPPLPWLLIQFRKHWPVAVYLPHRFDLRTQMLVWLTDLPHPKPVKTVLQTSASYFFSFLFPCRRPCVYTCSFWYYDWFRQWYALLASLRGLCPLWYRTLRHSAIGTWCFHAKLHVVLSSNIH